LRKWLDTGTDYDGALIPLGVRMPFFDSELTSGSSTHISSVTTATEARWNTSEGATYERPRTESWQAGSMLIHGNLSFANTLTFDWMRGVTIHGQLVDPHMFLRGAAIQGNVVALQSVAKNERAAALLRTWLRGSKEDAQEQRRSLKQVVADLNEIRSDDRKLFP